MTGLSTARQEFPATGAASDTLALGLMRGDNMRHMYEDDPPTRNDDGTPFHCSTGRVKRLRQPAGALTLEIDAPPPCEMGPPMTDGESHGF
jgi:hypothetical protein